MEKECYSTMTRAQKILSHYEQYEGLSKAAKAAAVGYIGYKIAKPLAPKVVNFIRPYGKMALLKAREYGITPETMKDFVKQEIKPRLQKYGVNLD